MPIFDRVLDFFLGPSGSPLPSRRTMNPENTPAALQGGGFGGANGFAAARINRLTEDFLVSSRAADQDLFGDNRTLRARARKLAIDNPHARMFLSMLAQNVVGPAGILMQAKIVGANGDATAQTDKFNERVEEEWTRWCAAGSCTADGRFSFTDLQHLAIKNCGREGENLVKAVYGRQFNACGFALQPLDNDQLDDTMMQNTDGGGQIRMGVEVDPYRRPTAYWLWSSHPNDMLPGSRERKRVPAAEIVHTAVWERPGQTRGYTWMAAAILSMNQEYRYQEAVIVAARGSAAKFATIEEEYAEGWPGDEDAEGDDTNEDGTQLMSGNAGEIMQLAPGQKLNFTDPRFPSNNHKEFTQTILRNIASGLLVSYPTLANDLEGVNFSSIRAGLVTERDNWRVLQRWFITHFLEPIFRAWLRMALLTTLSDVTLSPKQMTQFCWRARGWEWVDPQKDADAAILRMGNLLSTYTQELALFGRDFKETADERAREQKYIEGLQEKYGLRNPVTLGTDLAGDQGGKGVAAGDEGAAAKVEGANSGAEQGDGSKGSGKGKGGGKA
jgi:lambda family phage portal protein